MSSIKSPSHISSSSSTPSASSFRFNGYIIRINEAQAVNSLAYLGVERSRKRKCDWGRWLWLVTRGTSHASALEMGMVTVAKALKGGVREPRSILVDYEGYQNSGV